MYIEIEIISGKPVDDKYQTKQKQNQYEEVALFLDSTFGQELINYFRNKIKLKTKIPYEKFQKMENAIPISYELSKEHLLEVYKLENDIDSLVNREWSDLSNTERDKLERKRLERANWNDPLFLLSTDLKKELIKYGKISFLNLMIKAILCDEIKIDDWTVITSNKKGAYSTIYNQRECFRLYENYHANKDGNKGYGSVSKDLKLPLRTVASSVNSYKEKLKKYNATLPSQL